MKQRSTGKSQKTSGTPPISTMSSAQRSATVPEFVVLEPNWENTARWFANALATHSFDFGNRGAVGSFMEQIRYLALTDPQGLQKLIHEFAPPKDKKGDVPA